MQLRNILTLFNEQNNAATRYGWPCWPDAYMLDFQSNALEVSVVYNINTGLVYEVNASEKPECVRCFRYRDPAWITAQEVEAACRAVDNSVAYDNVHWNDIDNASTMLDMITQLNTGKWAPSAIVDDDEITIRVPDELFIQLARLAHQEDITVTALVTDIVMTELTQRNQQ